MTRNRGPRLGGWAGRIAAAALACAAAAAVGGCGYALAGRGSFLPDYVKTIGIPTFSNHTTVFNAETILSEKVRREFIGRGKYTVLPQASGVDAVITGEIAAITITPATFTPGQIASRYVITMTASVQLRDLHENKVLWENSNLVFRQDYEAQSGTSATDPSAFFGQDANALDRMSTEFAKTIVSSILEAF